MTREILSKELWSAANIITGFAVFQTISFSYASLKPEFNDPKLTLGVKITIAFFLIAATFFEAYAIAWCSKQCISLLPANNDDDFQITRQVINQSSRRRIIIVSLLIIPSILCLFAKNLKELV
jgi:hypothetical protein